MPPIPPPPAKADRLNAAQEAEILAKSRTELLDAAAQKKAIIGKIQTVVGAGKEGGISMLDIFDSVNAYLTTLTDVDTGKVKDQANAKIREAVEGKIGKNPAEILPKLEAAMNALLKDPPDPVPPVDAWTGGPDEPAYAAEKAAVKAKGANINLDDLYKLLRNEAGKNSVSTEHTRVVMLAYILRAAHRQEQAGSRFQHIEKRPDGKFYWKNSHKGYEGMALFDRATAVIQTPSPLELSTPELNEFTAEKSHIEDKLKKELEKLVKDKDLSKGKETDELMGMIFVGRESGMKEYELNIFRNEHGSVENIKNKIQEFAAPFIAAKNTKEIKYEILDTGGIADLETFITNALAAPATAEILPPGDNGIIDCIEGLKDHLDDIADTEALSPERKKKFFEEVNKWLKTFLDKKSGETPELKNTKILEIADQFKTEGWLTTPKPSFDEIWNEAQARGFDAVKNLAGIGPGKAQILFLLGHRRDLAREAEKETHWRKVIKIGEKWHWPNHKRGYENEDAQVGEGLHKGLLRREEGAVELTAAEVTEYEVWMNKKTAQEVKVKNVLDYISGFDFGPDVDLEKEARQIFEDFLEPDSDTFTAFAEQEACLDSAGKPDKEACVKRIRVYLQYTHGKLGYFEEQKEKITASEHGQIIDNLETAESILEELKDEMGKPDIFEAAEKLYEIIKYQGQGDEMDPEDKRIYLRYISLRDKKFPPVLRKDHLTMLYFLQAILNQKNGTKTNNLKDGENGWEKAEAWNTEESEENKMAFATDMHRYREVMGFLKEHEKRKSEGRKTEKQLREILEHLAKNYKKAGAFEGDHKAYFELLQKEFPDIVEKLRYVYKAILAMKETDIRKMKFIENTEKPEEIDPIEDTRNKYAELRRKLSHFRGSEKAYKEIDETEKGARENYCKSMRKKIENDVSVDPAVRGLSFLPANRDASREIIATKIVEKILEERRALLNKEIELQRESRWERFKTQWRKHPVARLCMGVGLGIAGFASGSVAVPAIIAMAGLRMVGGMVAVEGIWEAVRNRFGTGRNLHHGENLDIKKLAAYTTLATGTKPGYTAVPAPTAAGAPGMLDLPDIYAQEGAFTGYRARNYADAETKNKEFLKKAALDAMATSTDRKSAIKSAVGKVMEKEKQFLKAVEEREMWLRENNIKKKVTAALTGLVWGGSKLFDLMTPKVSVPAAEKGPGPLRPPTPGPDPNPPYPGPLQPPIPGPDPNPPPGP